MALENLQCSEQRVSALWKIDEDENFFRDQLAVPDEVPDTIHHVQKRLEYLSARYLLQSLLKEWNLPFAGIVKDDFGKPYLKSLPFQISLSHSYPYVAAVIDRNKAVGIDLEQPKLKLARIAPRVLSEAEYGDAGDDIVKLCVYWCAKESLVKIHGKKDLTFASEIQISPFSLQKQGLLNGSIIASGMHIAVPLQYEVYDNFVVAVTI